MTNKYGQGLYGRRLFGATLDTVTVTLTDQVTGEVVTATSPITIAEVVVSNPGPQTSVVGTQV